MFRKWRSIFFARPGTRIARIPSREPITRTMEQAQKRLAEWLATNLGEENKSPSHILATGYIALLLSQVYRTAPTSFLATPAAGGTSAGAARDAAGHRPRPEYFQHDAAPSRLRPDAPVCPPDLASLATEGNHHRPRFFGPAFTPFSTGGCPNTYERSHSSRRSISPSDAPSFSGCRLSSRPSASS